MFTLPLTIRSAGEVGDFGVGGTELIWLKDLSKGLLGVKFIFLRINWELMGIKLKAGSLVGV
jgi:hypothetical protein